MCTDTSNDYLNALHKCDDDDAPVITLEYGAFMNWCAWSLALLPCRTVF